MTAKGVDTRRVHFLSFGSDAHKVVLDGNQSFGIGLQ